MSAAWKPIEGAVDLHIHIAPDTVERYYDSVALAQEAAATGMAAVVLKDQMCPSVHKAILTEKMVPGVRVFGAVVLNGTVGGLNQRTVMVTVKSGGKVIWLPTVDAAWCRKKGLSGHWIHRVNVRNDFGFPGESLTITSEDGKLKPVVCDILKIAADYDAIVATGHVSPAECLALVDANANVGAKIIVTHPNLWFDEFTVDVLKQLVQGGATVEFVMGGLTPLRGRGDPQEIADAIRAVGVENCVLATDFGGIENSSPPEGLRTFAYILHRCGLTTAEIDHMTKTKPKELLGLV